MHILNFFTGNWPAISTVIILLLPVAEVIVRLTPTKCDDTVFDVLKKLFDKIIPNKKEGGGTFNSEDDQSPK